MQLRKYLLLKQPVVREPESCASAPDVEAIRVETATACEGKDIGVCNASVVFHFIRRGTRAGLLVGDSSPLVHIMEELRDLPISAP